MVTRNIKILFTTIVFNLLEKSIKRFLENGE